jgi:uncharacterized protein
MNNILALPPSASMPAKVVIERRVRAGADVAFAQWAERFTASASRARGYEGASVLSASTSARFILLRFATPDDLRTWQGSFEHAFLMREAAASSEPGGMSQLQSGLETWFTLPDMPTPSLPPPKWKMALLTWLCLLPMVIALGYAFEPLNLPRLVGTALSTAIPVSMLTWVVMPRLTRALYRWLYKGR